ncbi:nucleoside-diphosphate sugar epimerase/dehydratase [Bacteroides sp.]|uniref:polysaccharide biosynthesis protein n=1 Tax=Bacteroides sp. TaxID=29523 RepID=UPI002621891C|nr:nucleoside-diphosphate sugar epimerase/dehydratase [Bacteroides sp.]
MSSAQIRIFRQRISSKVLPIWTILLVDVLIVVLSMLLAYSFRYGLSNLFEESSTVDSAILWAVIVNLAFFHIFRTSSNVLRFSSFVDIMRIFVSLTAAYALLMVISLLSESILDKKLASAGLLFMSYIISFAMMSCLRILVKTVYDALNFDRLHSADVFIYGVKEAGVNIAKTLRANLRCHYRLRGFIADEPELVNKVIMGVRVFPNDDTLLDNLSNCGVQTVIVSPAKMDDLKNSDMADRLLSHDIKLMTAPALSEWNGKALKSTQLKEIQIEDLLQRAPIEIDIHKVASHLEGKRVLITGAAGSIGSEIMRQVASFNPYKLILVDQAETPLHDIRLELQDRWRDIDAETIIADISNATRMEEIFREFNPQYIFHAAAYKHVPMMEDNVSESIQVNVYGTRTLADLAVKYGVEKFVMISTDKAVNPTNVMGCSKRICEIYVQSLAKKLQKEGAHATQFITTRFGNVLGSNGSVIPRFRNQIQRGGPVTVTHPEIIRYFMTIPEACRLVLEAGSMGNGGEIYIFDMGKPVKIVDLARRMITLSGRTDVKIEFTGLRHGEKLYEELLNVKELTKPTYHEKIMIATVREYDYDEVKVCIENLIRISYTYDQMKIVSAMKELVPEFVSKNSCFEVLDMKLN